MIAVAIGGICDLRCLQNVSFAHPFTKPEQRPAPSMMIHRCLRRSLYRDQNIHKIDHHVGAKLNGRL